MLSSPRPSGPAPGLAPVERSDVPRGAPADFADAIVRRCFRAGLALRSVVAADPASRAAVEEAVALIDALVSEVQLSIIVRRGAWRTSPEIAVGRALDAIAAAEHVVRHEWQASTVPIGGADRVDRLVQCGRHLQAARRALDPDTLS